MPSRHFDDHAEDALSSNLYPSEQSDRSLSILDAKLLPTCVSSWRIAFNACCRPLQASMGLTDHDLHIPGPLGKLSPMRRARYCRHEGAVTPDNSPTNAMPPAGTYRRVHADMQAPPSFLHAVAKVTVLNHIASSGSQGPVKWT